MIRIRKISEPADLELAFDVRRIVFMDEQNVPEEEEFDAFERDSTHFLGFYNDLPCGTARWRMTPEGAKLERFAVLKEFRGKGVATALVEAVMKDVRENVPAGNRIYLNAQVDVVPLYAKFGFRPVGERFMECNIRHQQMELRE